jgi:hypothetical protein
MPLNAGPFLAAYSPSECFDDFGTRCDDFIFASSVSLTDRWADPGESRTTVTIIRWEIGPAKEFGPGLRKLSWPKPTASSHLHVTHVDGIQGLGVLPGQP